MANEFDLSAYSDRLEQAALGDNERQLVQELLKRIEQVTAENLRLRKALLRVSGHSGSRMSTKLKDALYE
ncbi:hypothetical protein [Paenibacillus sanguinis]|uniref:hypothetical protein n=1 Tax=Paenibacillus sanguinis TaxID=225906 RepID=UPI0003670AF0|nr:hypothetical protein [Paenibacillus sanguinis]